MFEFDVDSFIAAIPDNPDGWGPCELPDQFKTMPYQPFSKSEKLGRVSHVPRDYSNLCLNALSLTHEDSSIFLDSRLDRLGLPR